MRADSSLRRAAGKERSSSTYGDPSSGSRTRFHNVSGTRI